MIACRSEDSALGRWTANAWKPAADDVLHGLVERIWDFAGTLAYRSERTFPNGTAELVVQLDEPHRPAGAAHAFPPLCIDGLRTSPATVVAPPGFCRVLGIRLWPAGAAAVFRVSLAELSDRSHALDDVEPAAARELGARLADASDGEARVARAIAWLRSRVATAPELDPLVRAAIGAIRRDGGRAALGDLDLLAGRSRSRFAARFRDAVGLAPKRYARVVRFHHALERLRASSESLGRIASDAGYADQAHFNAEFRAHAGLTPLAYRFALRFPESDHLAATDGGETDEISKTTDAGGAMLAP